MRLVAALLGAAAILEAQAPLLPWEGASMPPWQPEAEGPDAPLVPPPPAERFRDLKVKLGPDGTLKVVDPKGTLRLVLGLPGRPTRVWRDGGRALEPAGQWTFPARTPLMEGRGELLLTPPDPRIALEGLLWILDDGERRLTVVHPATGKAVFLRLPDLEGPDLAFRPEGLEVRETLPVQGRQARRRWSLAWLALLPQFGILTMVPEAPRGTALVPFPRE